MSRYRINCPPSNYSRSERIMLINEQIDSWITSEPFNDLVAIFGAIMPKVGGLDLKLSWANEFVNIWDYRRIQSGGGERWTIKEEARTGKYLSQIMQAVEELGLKNVTEPLFMPDYLLPLGGARKANLARCLTAKRVSDLEEGRQHIVAALSGKRPINEIEIPYIQEYAPEAKTEFDAIGCGLEKAFSLIRNDYSEQSVSDLNPNLSWAIRQYPSHQNNLEIWSLAAPSSDENRRANSLDTFMFFLEIFKIPKGTKILLITSCVYVPFQEMKFMKLAIDYGFEVDCIGSDIDYNGPGVLIAENYLQEVKATINAFYSFYHECKK